MTIDLSANNPRIVYAVGATPQTNFVIPFSFFASSDVNVYVDGVLQTGGSDYVLSGDNADESPVVFTVAVSNCEVAITRDVPLERTTDFNVGAPFNGPALNDQLDRITTQIADIDDKASRALQLNDYETGSDVLLPDREALKGKVLAFNETTGDIEAGPASTDISQLPALAAQVQANADAAEADAIAAGDSATAAATSESNAATSEANAEQHYQNTLNHTFATSDLSDVDNTGRSDGAVLVFSDASSKYEATTTIDNTNTVISGGNY